MDQLIPVLATNTYRVEDGCVCVCQPATGTEILLSGLARSVWEAIEQASGANVEAIALRTADSGCSQGAIHEVIRHLVDLRILELHEETGW
jgi:hypothetical protein